MFKERLTQEYLFFFSSTVWYVFITGMAVSGITSDILHGCICHFTFIRITNSGLGKSHLQQKIAQFIFGVIICRLHFDYWVIYVILIHRDVLFTSEQTYLLHQ